MSAVVEILIHADWNGCCGHSLLARPIANAPCRLVAHANSEYSLLERIRYWHRTEPGQFSSAQISLSLSDSTSESQAVPHSAASSEDDSRIRHEF